MNFNENTLATDPHPSEYSEASKARAALERVAAESNKTLSTVIKDETNVASFPGFPYKLKARGESIIVNVDMFKSGYECRRCKGTGQVAVKIPKLGMGMVDHVVTCEECKGQGALLHLADSTKSLPSTGVVVSIGEDALNNNLDLKLYDRVLFGPHSGRFIPISKAGVVLKIMHEREATAVIFGGEDLAAFDFIDVNKNMEEY